jgi:hypothetical protein
VIHIKTARYECEVNLCPAAAVQKTAEAKRTRLGFLTDFSFKKFRVKHLDRVLICKKTQKTAKSDLFFAARPLYIVFEEKLKHNFKNFTKSSCFS